MQRQKGSLPITCTLENFRAYAGKQHSCLPQKSAFSGKGIRSGAACRDIFLIYNNVGKPRLRNLPPPATARKSAVPTRAGNGAGKKKRPLQSVCCKGLKYLARPEGIEPSTKSLEGSCSIRLSYGRNALFIKACRPKVKPGSPVTPKTPASARGKASFSGPSKRLFRTAARMAPRKRALWAIDIKINKIQYITYEIKIFPP